MDTTLQKYLSLTAVLAAMNCSPSTQQADVRSKTDQEYDCSSLDLTQKAGFFTTFNADGKKFCYRLSFEEGRNYESINTCDMQELPIPGDSIFVRQYAGPEKGAIQLNAILNVSSEGVEGVIEYVPFRRTLDGKISTIPGAAGYLENKDDVERLKQLFNSGAKMLDAVRNIPEVCKELLEYQL